MTSELDIISVHIPKTAGKAFNDVLLQVYGRDKLILDYANNPHDPKTPLKADIRAIHGHFPVNKYEKYFPHTKKIIWLRHPVMRIVSGYFYLKTRLEIVAVKHPKRYAVLSNSESTIVDFAQFHRSDAGVNPVYQQRYIDFNPEKLRDFYFVGIQEYFDSDLADLKAMMGWTEVTANPVNQNKYPDYYAKMLEILANPHTIERLESILYQEMELYQLALDLRARRRGEPSLSAKILLEQKKSAIQLDQFPKMLKPKQSITKMASSTKITVIVIFYNMRREARRTLFTLSTAYQRDVTTEQYEVIAIDNGSSEPLDPKEVRSYGRNFRYIYQPKGSASPAAALNRGIREAQTPFVMCIIDGARMLSPGVISHTLTALPAFDKPFVYTIGMHLGEQIQHEAILHGYNQQKEDRLLKSIPWRDDGYLLFNISCLAISSKTGFLSNTTESNCFTIKRDLLLNLGGFEEKFISPGGGLVNIDMFKRIVERRDIQAIALLGEATFHQFHGGAATNQPRDENNPMPKFHQEYQQIRGESFKFPKYQTMFWGHMPPESARFFFIEPKRNRMPSAKDRRETVIAVLGMHRSGTSCLAGSLQAAGLFSGKVEDWSVANSKGNRENAEIMALNNSVLKSTDGSWDHPPVEIKWSQSHREQRDAIAANYFSHSPVWMFKDPRTLLTLRFWQEGIKNLEFIGTFRHPMKVAMSLYQRDPMSITLREGIKLWCHYNSLLLREWQKSPFPLLCFDLPGEQYFDQLEQMIAKLSKYAHLFVAEAKKFYETKLVHQENIIAATELSCHDGQENHDAKLLARALKLYQDLKLAAGIKLDEESPGKSAHIVPLSETIAACEAGIKLQPENPHLYFILGNIQYKQQDFPAAIASYQQTLKIDSEYFAVYENLGDSFTRLDRLDEAINVYQKTLKLQPDNFKIYCILGKLYQKQGKSEAAISHCQKAIAINPKYVAGYNSLANIQRQRGEPKAAIISYRQSLELNPQQYEIYLALANSLFQIGQGEEAAIFFAKAQQLDREHPAAVNGLGSVARQQGNHGAAVEHFSHSLKLDPQQYNIRVALGHSLFQLEKFTEAAQAFQNAIALDNKKPALYTVLGNAQSKSGNIAAAIAAYEKAIALNPQQPFGVYKNLGDALSQEGEIDKAIAMYKEALKLKPNNQAVLRSLATLN